MVTIRDVAREAGVSVATVSRVFNDRTIVSEGTARQVREVAARLGYVPHSGARSLITNKTHTIGILLPDLYGEFFSEIIRGIDQAAQRSGYHVLVSSSHAERSGLDAALRTMRGRVDGLIVMSPESDSDKGLSHASLGVPIVLLSCRGDDETDSITVANFDGARSMTEHLLTLGHQRIAIITGSPRNFDAAERLRGYRAALGAAGIPIEPSLEFAGAFSERSGYEAAQRMLALSPRPTAVFASNDSMAIGAVSAVRDGGLRVPEDVAVTGFDDIPMARYMNPPLTSVHVDICALGERALARLFDVVHQRGVAGTRRDTLDTTLMIRRSCGANGSHHQS
jgi:LacI family transcriptional regulator